MLVTRAHRVALVAGVMVVFVHAAVSVLRRARLRSAATAGYRAVLDDQAAVEATSGEPESLPRTTLAAHARRDLGRACRNFFLALLTRVEAAGLIRCEGSRRNGDYLGAPRGSPLAGTLRMAMSSFGANRYGGAGDRTRET